MIEQPLVAKSLTPSTGQSIPSYATIWRPDMSKYSVMGNAAAAAATMAGYRGGGGGDLLGGNEDYPYA